ncbi:MAG: hypothetical protein B7Z58_07520 [Acidiphilium sp. 37-64-53]|uniref:hypothetical protein n=1 Tax=Acidiphilium TaxID=522 RepID=UPI000BD0DC02|nr:MULTISPECIES: hypothetical protein [Acidiphilium]OYW02439.1 MAG: hypothetical protein B7Z58_07520 [Acidiphilium sp. 37-64-53]OZB30226.1 MAG: hypothetical protein B7X49_03650 [Acidiphilium sp. 34-64-41]HQT84391.1 hypothetical protein [Acidiphilium rubrum]
MITKSPTKIVPPPEPSPLLDAVTTLTTVLEAENKALRQSDFGASGALADAKRLAIVSLESLTHHQPPSPRLMPEALHRRLDSAIEQNRLLLRRSIDTQQRVIATILQAIDPEPLDGHYPGHNGAESSHRNTAPVALTLRA